MAFGSGKKPANQGGMGKPYVQPAKKSGTPAAAKPGASKIIFGIRTEGIGGGKSKGFK